MRSVTSGGWAPDADSEGEDDRGLTASDTKTRELNQARIVPEPQRPGRPRARAPPLSPWLATSAQPKPRRQENASTTMQAARGLSRLCVLVNIGLR
jgi:hypothetical protein